MSLALFVKRIFAPHRFKIIKSYLGNQKELTVLDVGCGNNSCAVTKKWLPVKLYHGIDKEFWHGSESDYKEMDHVFFIDMEFELEKVDTILDNNYDIIILSHIIEHVKNGFEVLEALLPKLKKNGLIYVEAPHHRTLGYPSATGFLNFHDEPTHRMVYNYYDVSRVFLKHDLQILKAKTRRDRFRLIFFTPLIILFNFLYYLPFKQKIFASGLWDFLGVAFFVIAKKTHK